MARTRRGTSTTSKSVEDAKTPVSIVPEGAEDWSSPEKLVDMESIFSEMVDEVIKETGRADILGPDQAERAIVGLPYPSLALAYLYQNSVLPLGRVHQLVGEEGSCKSSYLYEWFRWNLIYGGMNVLFENENKGAPDMLNSILGYNKNWIRRTTIHPTNSSDDWQKGITFWIQAASKKFTGTKGEPDPTDIWDVELRRKRETGPGWIAPFMMGVDSFTATETEEVQEKIEKSGTGGRGFPVMALSIASYCRTLPAKLRNKPITIVGTNHQKPSQDYQGRPIVRIPGGKAIKFMETTRTEMTRGALYKANDGGGIRLKMRCMKNALGQTRREIEVDMLWKHLILEDGRHIQLTWWDWPSATIMMLVKYKTNYKSIWNQINEVVDLHPLPGRRIWSKELGFDGSAEAVSYSKLGMELEKRTDLVKKLYPILRIKERVAFRPGEDYRDTMAKAIRNEILPGHQIVDRKVSEALTDLSDLSDIAENLDSAVEENWANESPDGPPKFLEEE